MAPIRPPVAEPPAPHATRPVVLLIGGYAGCGKTTLGRALARRTGWPMLDKDTTTRPVVEAALAALGLSATDRESEAYRTLIRPAEYEALMAGMAENLRCGTSCIVTAPFVAEFASPSWCESARARIGALGGTAHFAWIDCDADTLRSHIVERGAARDEAKLAGWNTWIGSLDLAFRPATDHLVVANSGDFVAVDEVAKALAEKFGK
ncbi:AAA family ATPase [Kribbella deserti]|uniref:AAA family ATPase n=1 Tax=Kribbella deserti TaxID=1926257 RepID=A0ABV6QNU9_9ACTN